MLYFLETGFILTLTPKFKPAAEPPVRTEANHGRT